MKEVQLSNGQVAFVDDNDFDFINQHKWHCTIKRKNYNDTIYAKTFIIISGKRTQIGMHNLILGIIQQNDLLPDHKDGNGLNNTRDNLRACTRLQNSYNRKLNKNSTSGFKGVSFLKNRNRWLATIMSDGIKRSIGTFYNKIDAAKAYDKAALKYHGEFARLNFPIHVKTNEEIIEEVRNYIKFCKQVDFYISGIKGVFKRVGIDRTHDEVKALVQEYLVNS